MSKRYIAHKVDRRFYTVDVYNTTEQQHPTETYGLFTLQAEAEIIAFALNAIAEGWTLSKRLDNTGQPLRFVSMAQDYDGPTEGIA